MYFFTMCSFAQSILQQNEPDKANKSQVLHSKRLVTQKLNMNTAKPLLPKNVEVNACEHGYDLDGAPDPNCSEQAVRLPLKKSQMEHSSTPLTRNPKINNSAEPRPPYKVEVDTCEHGYDIDGTPEPNCGEPPMPCQPQRARLTFIETPLVPSLKPVSSSKIPHSNKVAVDKCEHGYDLDGAPEPNCGEPPVPRQPQPARLTNSATQLVPSKRLASKKPSKTSAKQLTRQLQPMRPSFKHGKSKNNESSKK